MEFSTSCVGPQTQPFHERDQGAGPLVDGFDGLPLGLRVQVRPTILQGRGQTVDHGDGRAQLMSGGGQEQLLLVLHDFLRGDVTKVHHPLVGTGDPCHEDLQQRPSLSLCLIGSPWHTGSGKGGWRPSMTSAEYPVSSTADRFHLRTRPSKSKTTMPSALESATACSWTR